MTWMRLRAELARSPDHPQGSSHHAYEFILPLDAGGRIDRPLYEQAPELCTVRRFWEDGDDSEGEIVRRADGTWAFSYLAGDEDDEELPHFAEHTFRETDYFAVRGVDGGEHTLQIVLVEPAPGVANTVPR